MKTLILLLLLAPATLLAQDTYPELVRQGLDLLKTDSLDAAERCFRAAMTLEPAQKGNALLWGHIGQIQARRGETDAAVESYTMALNAAGVTTYGSTLSATTMGLLLDRASLYVQQNRLDRALSDYNSVLDVTPDHREALLLRAYILVRQRLYKDARRDYEHLLHLDPRHAEALLGLAILCDKDRRPQEAMERINRYIALFPTRADGYLVRAGFEQDRRQDEAARDDFDHAIELAGDDPEAYLARARFNIYQKRKKEARLDLKRALDLGADPREVAAEMQNAR